MVAVRQRLRTLWIRIWIRPAGRYAAALLLVVLAAGVRGILTPWLGTRSPYTLFYPPVLMSAWFGGPGPGILAIAASTVLSSLFLNPVGRLQVHDAVDIASLAAFFVVGSCLVLAAAAARRARAEATHQAARHVELLERLNAGFTILDRQWRIVYINPEGAAIVRRSAPELIGQDLRRVFEPPPQVVQSIQGVLDGGAPADFEFEMTAWGRWFDNRVFPVDEGVAVVFLDITAQKTRDADRRLLAAIVDSSDDAIISKDLHGRILSWNAAAERMYGFQASEAVGQPVSLMIPENKLDEMFEIMERIRRGERIEHHETLRRRRSGEIFEAELTVSPIRDETGRIVAASKIARDVSSRRAAEREKQRTRELFLGILGHDLRNPLNTIVASLYSLEKNAAEPVQRAAARMSRATQRMTRMIEQLLDFTRARLGEGIPLRPERAELREICTGVVEEFEALHPARVRFESDGAGAGLWDADRMAQALSNLVGNALAHGLPEEPVEVSLSSRPDGLRLEVANRGPVIPETDRAGIFEPFRRAATAGQDSSGLGLGLYIAREIVRAHGGTIDVASDSTSTRFVVRLPVAAPEPPVQ